MKEKIFCYLTDQRELKKKNFDKIIKFYRSIVPDDIKFYIIDFTTYTKPNVKFSYLKSNKKINYLFIKNLTQIINFFKNKKILCAGFDSIDFKSIKVQFLINFFQVTRIMISDLGYVPSEFKKTDYSIKEKSFDFLYVKFPYIILRILSLFRIINKIDYFFEASQTRIFQIKNSISKKIDNLFGVNISFYNKIFRINSKSSDETLKKKKSNKFILYCDSGFDHPDKIKREGNIDVEKKELYYLYLYNLLNKLKKIFRKKIIFCKHPKNPYPKEGNFIKITKNYQVVDASAEKYLYNADIAIFHVSTLISRAIQLQKKIILVHSKLVGNYLHMRSKKWIKEINLFNIKLSKNYNIEKKKLNKSLINKTKLYEKFIKKNVTLENSKTRSTQIKKILMENFFEN